MKIRTDKETAYRRFLLFTVIGALLILLWYLRNVTTACDDILAEYVYAHLYGVKYGYKRTFNFCFSRGRAGFIFPAVVAFRYWIFTLDWYPALWAIQHIPVYFNVFLVSYIMGKRTRKEYGYFFALAFIVLLQITGWHSLIISYPIDFMYGLTMCILGLYLFQLSMENKSRRRRIIYTALSCLCFYESMQSYEAFLLAAPIYGLLALVYHSADYKKKSKLQIIKKTFVKLIPHICVSILFLGLYVYLSKHKIQPFPDALVAFGDYDLESTGTLRGFIITLAMFSGGMFPGSTLVIDKVREGIHWSTVRPHMIVMMILAAVGIWLFQALIRKYPVKKKPVIVLGIAALMGAGLFPAMHAYTARYQDWVLNQYQYGYVPTTFSYFGWIIVITCAFILVVDLINRKAKKLRLVSSIVFTMIFALGAFATCLANESIRVNNIGPASYELSNRAQMFQALTTDENFAANASDCIYMPNFHGLHGMFNDNQDYMKKVIGGGYDVTLTNDIAVFDPGVDESANPAEFVYDYDTDTGILMYVDDVADDGTITASGGMLIVTPNGGEFDVSIKYLDGSVSTQRFSLDSWESIVIDSEGTYNTSDVDVVWYNSHD